MRVQHYFDYKSPYAYLAQEASWALAAEADVELEWIPYTLQIPKYLGAAELDENGKDTVGTRNDHQWRRVRYSYMDCRREASRRGLIIRGPKRIFDSSVAHIAHLWVAEQGDFRRFHDTVFERFWRREIDLESTPQLLEVMNECGAVGDGFEAYAAGPGRAEHDRLQREAEAAGVFGVPSWRLDDELYWGLERLPRLYESLAHRLR